MMPNYEVPGYYENREDGEHYPGQFSLWIEDGEVTISLQRLGLGGEYEISDIKLPLEPLRGIVLNETK